LIWIRKRISLRVGSYLNCVVSICTMLKKQKGVCSFFLLCEVSKLIFMLVLSHKHQLYPFSSFQLLQVSLLRRA
jgi:hypothetical protein